MKRFLVLLLVCVLLCGCVADLGDVTHFKQMDYVRPDTGELERSCRHAINLSEIGKDPDAVLRAVWNFYNVYDDFMTNYDLAYIHYHHDLSDEHWQTEHDWCAERSAEPDMYLEELYLALAQSPMRAELEERYFGENFFQDYEGEGFYDETLMEYYEQEQALIARYYDLSESVQDLELYSDAYFDACALPQAEVLAQLIALRQEMADYVGYDSFPEFAWDYYYYRDYTPDQAAVYLEDIRTELVPLYENMNTMDVWGPYHEPCSEKETFAWVKTAAQAMGGVTAEAFGLLEAGGLYDIAPSPKKSGLSFELWLLSYAQPYVFVSGAGTGYDKLTFAHEFGHFATDYAAGGSWAGTDVLEIFSQGMEYLSLSYAGADQAYIDMKLADSLCTYVEQAAYADFEAQMYTLTGDELTGENLLKLYEDICTSYGFTSSEWDPRDLVTVPHFYTSPMYIISYVVSNDAAMQLYEMELQEPGTGKTCFEENLATEEAYFLAFLEEAGLDSPFDRIDAVAKLMGERFGN